MIISGDANIDFEMIRCLCPKLKRYIVVEPRGESLEVIQNKFKELPYIQVSMALLERLQLT